MTRKTYTDEFRADAVAKYHEAKQAGTPVARVAEELGVTHGMLSSWADKAKSSKRTQYPLELKQKAIAMATAQPDKSKAEIARELQLPPHLVQQWLHRGVKRGAKGDTLPATIPASPKAVNGIGSGGDVTDALIYLRHAEREILDMVRDGKIARPDQAHLLTLLALGALQRGINK